MQIPLQITFRNVKSSQIVQQWIHEEAAKLDAFYPRIMGCRVAIEMPHQHHRRGSVYHVRIDLTLPGGEVVIKRQPTLAPRARQVGEAHRRKRLEVETPHKNLRLAIDDAFKAAGRRLQDYARRQSGHVKTHEPPALARVSRLVPEKGFGFLTTQDGREVYFHQDSVLNGGFRRLKIGATVAFAEEMGDKGPQASTVRVVRKPRGAGAGELAAEGAG